MCCSPPVVRVTAPATELVTLPAPASEPRVSLNPARSNVAPAATVSALLEPTALATPSFNVPTLTVVAPVYVFVAPRTSAPGAILGDAAGGRADHADDRRVAGAADGQRLRCATDCAGESQRAAVTVHARSSDQGQVARPGVVVGQVAQCASCGDAGAV